MKNVNEEAEILSAQDEKIQLNSNPNINQGNNAHSHNHIQIPVNNNRNEITNNNNKNANHKFNLKFDRNALNKLNMRMNQEQYMHHGQLMHQHQQGHTHDFSNPRYLYNYILNYIKMGNFYIQRFFAGITSSLDLAISKSSFNPYVKNLIHSKQIFLILYIINIQYLLSTVEKITFLNFLNENTRSFMILSALILYLHYFFLNQKLFLERDEEMEKFVIKRNPQIKKGKCDHCDVLKVMRSSHCIFCNKCIKKFQLHSDWFNICIGANNELLYAITLFFFIVYFFTSNLILLYYILFRRDLLLYLTFIFTLFAICGIYICFISGKFLYDFIFECLLINLTYYEKMNSRRMNYLFGDGYGRSFFNPFNKGIQRNLEEMLINMFDINIYHDYKNCQDLSELIDESDDNTKKEEQQINYYFDEVAGYQLMIKLVEHFDPVITSKDNIYKFVDGKEIINWNRLMIFTVFDVINSPFKDMMVKQAKYFIDQREAYMQSVKAKNKNEGNEKKEDEKIDENENEGNKEEKEDIKEEKEELKENEENNKNEKDKEDN